MSIFKRFILVLTSLTLALVMLLMTGCSNDTGDDDNETAGGEQLTVTPDLKDPFSVNSWSDLEIVGEVATAPTDSNISADSFVVGETIYAPTLTGSGRGVPEGWLAVPDALVAWPNGGAAGGWANYSGTDTDANEEINTAKFSYSDAGLKASIGGGDFSLLMPTLKDSAGNEVDDYVYTVKASFPTGSKGQFGLITGTRGSDVTYKGGIFHCYYAPNETNSWYYYHYSAAGRSGTKVADTDSAALPAPVFGQQFTISIYHCDGMNYLFVNDKYVHTYADVNYYDGEKLSGIGLYFCNSSVVFNEITVKKANAKTQITDGITLSEPTIVLDAATNKANGLSFVAKVDKSADFYAGKVSGNYDVSDENVKFGMLVIARDSLPENGVILVDTPNVTDIPADKVLLEDSDSVAYSAPFENIADADREKVYVARAYAKVKDGDTWTYYYSKTEMLRSYVGTANIYYTDCESSVARALLDEAFAGCDSYVGADVKTMTFSVFADLHYYKNTYITSVAKLENILARANEKNVDFVIQAGDFCNNFRKSPEIINTYINNKYDLPVYGVIGNHDLENGSDMMNYVTDGRLTNREVVWGTANGSRGNGSIAYYYFDTEEGFRVICLDSNYYYNTAKKVWEHYPDWYSGPSVKTYSQANSLGDTQRAWLEKVLMDAADKDMPCIVMAHAAISGNRNSESDAKLTREIFAKANEKNLGTVLMVINGHHHSNHTEYVDGILYLDMNTSNGPYVPDGNAKTPNYPTNTVFEYVEYDTNGQPTGKKNMRVNDLASIGKNEMYYYEDSLSAIVHVSSNGRIIIEGDETKWFADFVPSAISDAEQPLVNSGIFSVGMY